MSGRARRFGFTLIEVVVAVFLLGILSALAYQTLAYVQKTRENSQAAFARLREVEVGVHAMVTDFEQLEPRPIRQPVGDGYLAAIVGDTRTQDIAVLTRGGWANTAGLPRPALQRVTYTFDPEKATLYRSYTNVLDSTLSTPPVRRELLHEVRSVKFRFMDPTHVWQAQWPPTGTSTVAVPTTSVLAPLRARPVAVEIIVELKDWGTITRLVEGAG